MGDGRKTRTGVRLRQECWYEMRDSVYLPIVSNNPIEDRVADSQSVVPRAIAKSRDALFRPY